MKWTGFWLMMGGFGIGVYAYAVYPLLLALLSRVRQRPPKVRDHDEWPVISITIPAYNEEAAIAATLDWLLATDYPADKRQILVVSDGSTDRTDEIARAYADRGVELLRLETRSGKTAAENAARSRLRGEIIINTDASARVHEGALKSLVRRFSDPEVGVASGRDVSVASMPHDLNLGESGYVSYEMWLRGLETGVGSIVGASGCLYASRRSLQVSLPEALSRDFAAALIAREHGYRAVSVNDAVCFVPRISSLQREYRRKVRTMTRGLETLFYKRHLLNPLRHGLFAWMLWSHKLVRWLVPWGVLLGVAGFALWSISARLWWLLTGGLTIGTALALTGWNWPEERQAPRIVAVPAYVASGTIAALTAWINTARGDLNPIWEPTRRVQPPNS